MPSEVDPRLVRLLKASLGFVDALRDAGVGGGISVSLDREGGLGVLQLVAGNSGPLAEAYSQRNRPLNLERNSLSIAGLTIDWPRRERAVLEPVNDNRLADDRFRFEEETPALR